MERNDFARKKTKPAKWELFIILLRELAQDLLNPRFRGSGRFIITRGRREKKDRFVSIADDHSDTQGVFDFLIGYVFEGAEHSGIVYGTDLRFNADMDDTHRRKLIELATQFRATLERARDAGEERICWLQRFPENCCDFSAWLLCEFLEQNGFDGIVEASTDLSDVERHVWLEIESTVIDITADQFGSEFPPVIVSDSSEWHLSHKGVERQPCDHRETLSEMKNRGDGDWRCIFDWLVER